MPDSFPPLSWGPPPFDERDLEALLSGETTDTPVALRQVADALAALRAAPTQAELTGEEVARAEFRALVLDDGARTDGLPYAQVLSALTLDGAHRPPARHRGRPVRRRRRSFTRPVNRRGGILLGAAAAVVIVAAVALTGSLSGPFQGLVRSTADSTSAATRHSPGGSSSGRLTGSGAAEPTTRPTPAHSPHASSSASHGPARQAPAQASECRTYYGYFQHMQPGAKWSSAELDLLGKLSKQAGGYSHVYAYCASYLGGMFAHGLPWWAYPQPGPQQGAPGQPGTPSPGTSQQGADNTGSGQARKPALPVAP